MVLVATQVKRRRGTTAENDAFTGAEGEITVDTEKHELRVHDGQTQGGFVIGAGGSGSGRNIGDIFYTTRKDSGLGGAVECNGGTYSTADYTGAGSIGELLEGGLLDYISLTDYATAISTKGWCDKIGWDGTGTTSFRVPTLTPHIIQKNNIPVVGNNMPIYMKNGLTSPDAKVVSTASYDHTLKISGTGGERNDSYFSTDPTKSGIIADTTDTAQLRVMFQLFNGTTDEAVATVGMVVAQVGELNSRTSGIIDYVVEKQDPTTENGWTWYRLYKSGLVEQGGEFGGQTSIAFPIEMADTHYEFLTGLTTFSGSQSFNYNSLKGTVGASTNRTTTGMSGMAVGASIVWRVSGMSA